MTPDIFIEFGPRSILSIVGIITLISGVWYVDRTWDEKGSAAYKRAKAKSSDPYNVTIPIIVCLKPRRTGIAEKVYQLKNINQSTFEGFKKIKKNANY